MCPLPINISIVSVYVLGTYMLSLSTPDPSFRPRFNRLIAAMAHSPPILAHLMALHDPYLLSLRTCNHCIALLPIRQVKNSQLPSFGTFYIAVSILPCYSCHYPLISTLYSVRSVQSQTPNALGFNAPDTSGASHATILSTTTGLSLRLARLATTALHIYHLTSTSLAKLRVHACTGLVRRPASVLPA